MCVQYRGGCSVPWGCSVSWVPWGGVQYRGGYHEYRGGLSWVLWGMLSTVGGYHDARGGYHEYHGGYLEYRGGVQYRGGYHDKCGGYLEYVMRTVGGYLEYRGDAQYRGGYHEYREGVQYCGGKIFCYLSTPRYWTPPTVLSTPHGIAHTLYRVLTQGAAKYATRNQMQIFCYKIHSSFLSNIYHSPWSSLYHSMGLILFKFSRSENLNWA